MSKKTNMAPKIDTVGRRVNQFYPTSKSISWKNKIRNVLLWSIFVGIISALVVAATVLSGGAVLPGGVAMSKYLLIHFGIGATEGLLYGTLSEVLGAKQASEATNQLYGYVEKKQETVREVSLTQFEVEESKHFINKT